ncbi:MAG: hypothetical protein RJA22_786 [Verrucomicrobiota bacterium]|jgi:hypothetical protein
MKMTLLLLTAALATVVLVASAADVRPGPVRLIRRVTGELKPDSSKKLLHVVAFKFKASATPEQIKEVTDGFSALPKQIKVIKSLEWGVNVSPEKHDKGFTHGWVLSFKSEKDRDDYLVHPAHEAFVKVVGPVVEDVFVIDYWARE